MGVYVLCDQLHVLMLMLMLMVMSNCRGLDLKHKFFFLCIFILFCCTPDNYESRYFSLC